MLSFSFIACKYSNSFSSSVIFVSDFSWSLIYSLIITSHWSLYCTTNRLPSSVIILYILSFLLFQYIPIFVSLLNNNELFWGIILLPFSFIACKYSNNLSSSLNCFLSYSLISTSHWSLYCTTNGLLSSVIILYILSFLSLQ